MILEQLQHNYYYAGAGASASSTATAAFIVTNRRRSNTPIISSPISSKPPYSIFVKRENYMNEQVEEKNEYGWGEQVVKSFIKSLNSRDDPAAIVQRYFDDNVTFIDTSFYNPIHGKDSLTKHFYLHAGSSALSTFPARTIGNSPRDVSIVIDDIVSSSASSLSYSSSYPLLEKDAAKDIVKVCVLYHLEATATITTTSHATAGETTPGSQGSEDRYTIHDTRAITFYHLENEKIVRVFDVTEPPSPKPGDSGLRLLRSVAKIMEAATKNRHNGSGDDCDDGAENGSIVEQYFAAWNRRDISEASQLFATDCIMNDMQYETAFYGREELTNHLLRVKDCLPTTFNFRVDDIVSTSNKAGALWHVENNESSLAFTRGCSFYTFDEQVEGGSIRTKVIQTGVEIPEKAPPKMGFIRTLVVKFKDEPTRALPATLWVAYMYILFFSDGILPGANVLALEQRTWEEVRDLSLNFFFVAPMLKLSFSPIVHPVLEGVFNFLLSWAAMFAGFLSDERKEKPNLLPFGAMLLGMQFLTSGFLLPYLFTRTPEITTRGRASVKPVVYQEDIDGSLQRKIAEWRPLGIVLGGVGALSIVWALFARDDFGRFDERYSSFLDLLSIDRVGSSFIVDLVIFALFQSWFVDDDLERRGVERAQVEVESGNSSGVREFEILRNVAKYIPFFGLAVYLSLRPSLPTRHEGKQSIE